MHHVGAAGGEGDVRLRTTGPHGDVPVELCAGTNWRGRPRTLQGHGDLAELEGGPGDVLQIRRTGHGALIAQLLPPFERCDRFRFIDQTFVLLRLAQVLGAERHQVWRRNQRVTEGWKFTQTENLVRSFALGQFQCNFLQFLKVPRFIGIRDASGIEDILVVVQIGRTLIVWDAPQFAVALVVGDERLRREVLEVEVLLSGDVVVERAEQTILDELLRPGELTVHDIGQGVASSLRDILLSILAKRRIFRFHDDVRMTLHEKGIELLLALEEDRITRPSPEDRSVSNDKILLSFLHTLL